ncbi:hypothetical protein [Alteribacillus sp. HJP-4]|uniref:hypothetical protein n=1 Tax=Alteribacillus sp. HJP-4 TaxID=2775394 RepID=UPI0035CCE0D7
MKEININTINETINSRSNEVNYQLKREFSAISSRRKNNKIRSKGEVEALDLICIQKWNRAVEEGKIKRLGERELYYEFD